MSHHRNKEGIGSQICLEKRATRVASLIQRRSAACIAFACKIVSRHLWPASTNRLSTGIPGRKRSGLAGYDQVYRDHE